MTISNITVKQLYTGDGTTTVFAIPFNYFAETEVVVILRDETVPTAPVETVQTVVTNYSLTGSDPLNGILSTDVTMVIAPTATDKLLIKRSLPNTQETDYINTSVFPAESHELAMDRIAAQVQEAQEALSRAPLMDATTASTNLTLEDPVAGQLLRWNAGADGIDSTPNIVTQNLVSVIAAYPVTSTDEFILANAGAGAFTVTMPAPSTGRRLTVKKTDATANAVTVGPNAAELFDGAANIALAAQYDFVSLVSNGTDWFIVAETDT